MLNGKVVGAFATAVVLHALWDTFNSLPASTSIGLVSLELLSLLVAVVMSLALFVSRVREARREPYEDNDVEKAQTG